MFGRIRSDFECLEGSDQNANVWKDSARIPMFGRIGPELKCFEG